uniref:Uncharacterized protein n=1 Tax=Rhizophora mucronata TaxID=61149 RepID=A0A2P2PGD2_RHIMU
MCNSFNFSIKPNVYRIFLDKPYCPFFSTNNQHISKLSYQNLVFLINPLYVYPYFASLSSSYLMVHIFL